ncbi:UNVERIFIED_CONTAM: hypothetical protein PYX00_000834 [Menopon gallinae]|uniref:Uncharacterized protein n=1 Tax=Menopon gallinae TaxID=328185 RepID=A0AAW2IBZ5_9NEOP
MSLADTVWRQFGFQKADQMQITCATYLTGERILCGTADGKLLYVEGGDMKAIFNALTVTVINAREKDEVVPSISSLVLLKTSSDFAGEEDKQVRALISFTKGFAYSCKSGLVHMFEKETQTQYRKRNVFKIVEMPDSDVNIIKHLSINVSHDKLLATTSRPQIFTVRLWGPDIHVAPEIPFKILGEPLHHGPVIGVSMCRWKPLFLTGGKFDKTVRLWNYDTQTVEMVKDFYDDIYSVAIHPTGYFAAIGFTEKLLYMIILLDDIQPCRQLPVRQCYLALFCLHGQYLAAVRQSIIEVYSSISFQNMVTFKGHSGKILSMVWSADDKKLVSCSDDGFVLEWDMVLGKKIGEVHTDGIAYTDCAITSDGKFIYAVGSDGILREITESLIIRTIEFNQKTPEKIVLSRSDVMMFLCAEAGSVLSVKIPINIPVEFASFYFHYSRVSHMKLSFDDQTLVTPFRGRSGDHLETIPSGRQDSTDGQRFLLLQRHSHQ